MNFVTNDGDIGGFIEDANTKMADLNKKYKIGG